MAVARLLGKATYGELGMINSTVGTLGFFAGMGLGVTATKYLAQWRSNQPARVGRLLGLLMAVTAVSSASLTIALMFFAPYVAQSILHNAALARPLRIVSPLLLITAFNGVQMGALSGFEAFRTITRINLWRGLLNFPIMVLSTWLLGLNGSVAAMVLVTLALCYMSHQALSSLLSASGIKISLGRSWDELSVLWAFSLPSLAGAVVNVPATWLGYVLLGRMTGGYGEIALLNVAFQWRQIVLLVPNAITNAALPALSSILGAEAVAAKDHGLEILNVMNQLVVWPTAIAMMLLAAPITAAYGRGFAQGRVVFIVLIGATAVVLVFNAIMTLIISSGAMWFLAWQNAVWGVVLLAFTYAGRFRFGGLSLALGMAAGYTIMLVCCTVFAWRRGMITGGLAQRTLASGFLILTCMAIAILLPGRLAGYLAVPSTIAACPFALRMFGSESMRNAVWRRVRGITDVKSRRVEV